MNTRALDVFMDGTLCGRVEQSPSGNLTFRYDPEYQAVANSTPLSLSMPLAATLHKKRSVLPFLQGLLPDSEGALQTIARRFRVSPSNPFAILEHIGADVAGALQFMTPGAGSSDGTLSRGAVQPVSDADVAEMLDHVVTEYKDGTPYDDSAGRFSLAGAQPKIALHQLPNGKWAVPEDATPTTHILKPAAGTFSRLDVVEQLTMRAAAFLGLGVAKSELARIGEWDVFVTRRYDRQEVDGTWRRIHQEDFCQALSVSPAKKYQHRDGGPGASDMAALVRSLPFEADRRAAGEGLYRAFVFNTVAGCTDAHAKNYSVLLNGSRAQLSPLYDLATYAPYWDAASNIDLAMSVKGEYTLQKISKQMLVSTGTQFGVDAEAAREIVEHYCGGIVEAFEAAGEELKSQLGSLPKVAEDTLTKVQLLPLVEATNLK
ncbi:type II toxin-antitoxin system HipA family toxin [Paenarthrobacter aurescens]|nr:type II toxin-antitoxin system HipA family toxin [Paenarthrobacter aurescens]MDO6149056.1 type II toxin-antitoxin system HipA family toxin [Paenarthrobacter aurescens]MDO6164161.1 type II toxin-antitoxin system HipA family toxin [Paenarthrobacter aurescens]